MWHRKPFTVDPDFVTAPAPRVLWIELTSKCPFDCIFCTRRSRFGAGRNLDFELYRKLIAELDAPDFIGLNYSGESIYYPRLLEAIALARSTGAYTELVTAFPAISGQLLRGIVESGLDRLAISLHTMDPEQYRKTYRFSSLDAVRRGIDEFLGIRASLGAGKPRMDFCFVAMNENLDQLRPVADYAAQAGAPEIFVHPIIGRHLAPQNFSVELAANQLRDGFKEKLRMTIASVREAHPGLPVTILNPDVECDPRLSRAPGYYAPALPNDARIHTCDQSPFESVHILAGGDVVACEVHDEVALGNLNRQSLREIWLGDAYREFRRKYVAEPPPACRNCVWKMAYTAEPWRAAIAVGDGLSPQLLRGWHSHEGTNIIWSKRQSLLALKRRKGAGKVLIAGVLPPGPGGHANCLRVTCNRVPIGEIANQSGALMAFDTSLALPAPSECLYLEFSTMHLFRPSLESLSNDARDLGFGLRRIEVCR